VPGPLLITCTGGAEGKCIRFGYKPWHPLSDGTSLEPYYRACVRLVRADYGGDGVGHTRNGTPIDLFDPDWHFSVTKPPLCASRGEAQNPQRCSYSLRRVGQRNLRSAARAVAAAWGAAGVKHRSGSLSRARSVLW
jgi:hypothetical protein